MSRKTKWLALLFSALVAGAMYGLGFLVNHFYGGLMPAFTVSGAAAAIAILLFVVIGYGRFLPTLLCGFAIFLGSLACFALGYPGLQLGLIGDANLASLLLAASYALFLGTFFVFLCYKKIDKLWFLPVILTVAATAGTLFGMDKIGVVEGMNTDTGWIFWFGNWILQFIPWFIVAKKMWKEWKEKAKKAAASSSPRPYAAPSKPRATSKPAYQKPETRKTDPYGRAWSDRGLDYYMDDIADPYRGHFLYSSFHDGKITIFRIEVSCGADSVDFIYDVDMELNEELSASEIAIIRDKAKRELDSVGHRIIDKAKKEIGRLRNEYANFDGEYRFSWRSVPPHR